VSTGNTLAIRTPDGIEFRLPLAGPFSRMLALAVDLAVIAMLGSVLQRVIAPLAFFGEDVAGAVQIVLYFAITILYGLLTEWLWRG
jgi:hypothetical protein